MNSDAQETPINEAQRTSVLEVRPRWWPPVVIVVLQYATMVACATLAPETPIHFVGLMASPPLATLLLILWWLFFSRVPVRDRVCGLLMAAAVVLGCRALADKSMAPVIGVYGVAALTTMVTGMLLLSAGLRWSRRRWLLALTVAGTCMVWTVLRLDGLDGNFVPGLSLRWSATVEDALVASTESRESSPTETPNIAVPLEAESADWPGFRGPARDGKVRGVRFATNWNEAPPRELWRRPVGPGWSSFAAVAGFIFTQEQRHHDELVVCYALADGQELWTNRVSARFQEIMAGPGPRATPTFSAGKLFTLGATGILQCIDPTNGKDLWQSDLKDDVQAPTPIWGFSSSPLALRDLIVVFSGVDNGKSVVAYDRNSGDVRWSSGDGNLSYASCQLETIDGIEQILMTSNIGLQSFEPANGALLWEHRWPIDKNTRVLQPLVFDDGAVLIGTGYGFGTRRVDVKRNAADWTVNESWTSRALKPYFNDFVEHDGHCYGFDARIFTCINLADGKRRWKQGRYGHGQVLLVVDAAVLVVVGEHGELVLLEANPDEHRELARIEMLDGKTWNHPVITQGKLIARNGAEMVCLELPGYVRPTE
jgi:outer membrane protein assembly factor BamB